MNTQTDLITLIENDLGPGRKSGRWVMWRCPFHNDHFPSLAATNGDEHKGPYWKCFTCSEKRSDRRGGPLAWLMEYRHLDKGEALNLLNGNRPSPGKPGPAPTYTKPPDYPPGPAWQERARHLVERAIVNLWEGKGREPIPWQSTSPDTGEVITKRMTPLEWLHARGLHDDTLRTFQIGYIPPKDAGNFDRPWEDTGQLWGMEEPVKYFPGILIPCLFDQYWYLKIRRPQGKPKYLHIRGSRPALYLAQTLEVINTGAVIFCEGELDALLLWQEIEFDNLAAVVTLGSATTELNTATWGWHLLGTNRRFTAYDPDKAGQQGASKLSWMHTQPLTVPQIKAHDKDITDFYTSGGDLRSWARQTLESPQKPTGSPTSGLVQKEGNL